MYVYFERTSFVEEQLRNRLVEQRSMYCMEVSQDPGGLQHPSLDSAVGTEVANQLREDHTSASALQVASIS